MHFGTRNQRSRYRCCLKPVEFGHSACIVYKLHGLHERNLERWSTFLKLAVPGILMVCVEVWTAQGIAFFTDKVFLGMSIAVSIRIGINLGAGNAEQPRVSARVTIGCGTCFAAGIAFLLVSLKDVIPHFFSNDETVISMATSLTPLLAIFKFFDIYQILCTGILRGIGFQNFGAVMNFIGNFLIGLPVALSLMLASPLGVAGALWGIITGAVVLCVGFSVRIITVDWKQESIKARKRAGLDIEDITCIVNDETENIHMGDKNREIRDYRSFDSSAQSGEVSSNTPTSSATNNQEVYSKVVILVIVGLIFAGGLSIRLTVKPN